MTALVLLALLVALLVALAAGPVRAAWGRWARRTWPHCLSCARHAHGGECTRCELYLCAGCSRWVSWDLGAADDMPQHCDDCWALAHGADA